MASKKHPKNSVLFVCLELTSFNVMASKKHPKNSVLFVCLGNICRSPMAEAIFRAEVAKRGMANKWMIDSAAIIDWNVGKCCDHRAVTCLQKKGLNVNHRARQIKEDDFSKFDVVFGMDMENMQALSRLKPQEATAKLMLLGEFDPQHQRIIEDPYHGSTKDFETVYEQCSRCCAAVIDQWKERVMPDSN